MIQDREDSFAPEAHNLSELSSPLRPRDVPATEMPQTLGGLPVLELSGTPEQMGTTHGRRFSSEISLCADIYNRVWSTLSFAQVTEFVSAQRNLIEKHFPHYAEEICALAAAADINETTAFALNGRTEITLHQHTLELLRGCSSEPAAECTLLGSPFTKVMGENWDWASCIEKITVLNHITRPDGHRILTMTEPGIIGKVGMNSAGIGVGLNFIPGTERNSGIPVHIILRACLEASSFEQISDMLDEFARKDLLGTMSAISIMDKRGNAEMFEILGSQLVRTRRIQDHVFAHTNHPLLNPSGHGTTDLQNTLCRLNVAQALAAKGPLTVDALATILADRSDQVHSINMQPKAWGAIGSVGTIRSLIFDLENGTFYISKGTPAELPGPVDYDRVKLY